MTTADLVTVDRGGAELAQTAADLRLVLGRILRRLRTVGSGALTATQLSALANLDEHGPLRLRDLARHEGVRPPTASRLVDPLAERGLVSRESDPGDARGTVVTLTDAGRVLLGQVRDDRTATLAEALSRLPPAQARALRDAVPMLSALLCQLGGPRADLAEPRP